MVKKERKTVFNPQSEFFVALSSSDYERQVPFASFFPLLHNASIYASQFISLDAIRKKIRQRCRSVED